MFPQGHMTIQNPSQFQSDYILHLLLIDPISPQPKQLVIPLELCATVARFDYNRPPLFEHEKFSPHPPGVSSWQQMISRTTQSGQKSLTRVSRYWLLSGQVGP